jgi:hypothetical protein
MMKKTIYIKYKEIMIKANRIMILKIKRRKKDAVPHVGKLMKNI